jgi:hypothetical protein
VAAFTEGERAGLAKAIEPFAPWLRPIEID